MHSRNLYCVDFEITRDGQRSLHIIEIGAIRLDDAFRPCREFSCLVRPPCRIDPIDARVTGLSDQDLALAEPPSSAFPRLLSFIGNAVVLAHNAKYDKTVVEVTCDRLSLAAPNWSYIDTLKLARRFITARSYSLSHLVAEIGISYEKHRALSDCVAAAALFQHIVSIMETDYGEHALQNALDIGRINHAEQGTLF